MPKLKEAFREVLRLHTAGDPDREEVVWTNLTKTEIAARLAQRGFKVSVNIVTQLLDDAKFHRRKLRKTLAMGSTPLRNEQFEYIAELRAEYEAKGWPILSYDVKKKESLGPYYRPGLLYGLADVPVYDHDFLHAANGLLIPHGLYDLRRNVGHLYLGLSHDTSEFGCDNVYRWWMAYGRWYYGRAESLLLLCDGGGHNDSRHYIFKYDLQRLANRIGIEIRVAHYPPYTSKYNPIEHRLFPHVTRACAGTSLPDLETAVQLLRKTRTRTGLRVTVKVVDKYYATKRTCPDEFRAALPLEFDAERSSWNYRAVPQADAHLWN